MATQTSKKWIIIIVTLLLVAAWYGWEYSKRETIPEGFVTGNGRIEATEIDVAAKLPGRVGAILVREGEFVEAGQVLATMEVQTLQAQLREAQAQLRQAGNNVQSAQAQVVMRISEKQALQAQVHRTETELDAAQRRLERSETLAREGATSAQQLDDDRARMRAAQAAVVAAKAQVAAADAAIAAARAQVTGVESAVEAVQATIARIQAEIDDSQLKAPLSGRVQYRVAQPGEVVGAGGKILNLIDLSDVYMSFFMPETVAGRVALGSEVRIVLDAAPHVAIPARVSFVASSAQFTPKTVETASERQKLMFRVRAQIDRELLLKYLDQVKTGLPGVAWIRLDPQAEWPAALQNLVAQ